LKKERNGKLDKERKLMQNESSNQKGNGDQWQCIAKLKKNLNPWKEHKLHEFVEIRMISF
jgi:hypothetical protein